MEGYGEDSGRTFLSSRVKSFSDLLQRPGHGWGPWKPIPPPLCVNTESLAAIKAIPARYLTAFKMVQSCESAKTPSFHDVVFHFPPFHIDFRGTMKFLTEAVVQLAPTKKRGGRERRRRRGKNELNKSGQGRGRDCIERRWGVVARKSAERFLGKIDTSRFQLVLPAE